jgi:hypothetical protein
MNALLLTLLIIFAQMNLQAQDHLEKRYKVLADTFDQYLMSSLDYSAAKVDEKAFPESNAKGREALKKAKEEELRSSSWSDSREARTSALAELRELAKTKTNISDDDILLILDKHYHKRIQALDPNYLDFIRSKLKE